MARKRSASATIEATDQGENDMSDTEVEVGDLFEDLTPEQWKEQGGGGSTERGLYSKVLTQFAASGKKYAVISMARGRFAGKKASSVATALKNTKDAKNAPEGVENIKITSKGDNAEKNIDGAVFLENTAVEA